MSAELRQYTVTQLRLGASCPRVHYFDADWSRRHGRRRVTLLWKEGGVPAGGALFHRAVERFTRLAGDAEPVRAALARAASAEELHEDLGRFFAERCYDPGLARRPLELQRGFSDALFVYLRELAVIASHARANGVEPARIATQLFGDPRKRVDVTFTLADGQAVRVTGEVDYVFYDWRTGRHRIFDYKLTPGTAPQGDRVQVSAYALMHDRQHGTHPDVAVYYLHPERRLDELPWEQVWADRARIYDYLASMIAWEAYDPSSGRGLLPPGVPALCGGCAWRRECEARLGPKTEGALASGWSERFARGEDEDPPIEVREPPEALPEPEVLEQIEGSTEPRRELPPDHLWIGVAEEDGAPLFVPTKVLNTHVAVLGAAGSGKTWTAKVIAEEAVRNGIPVVAIDPQGDLVQFLTRQRHAPVGPWSAEQGAALGPLLDEAFAGFADRVETRVYTPGSSHATRLALDPIRLPRAEDLAAIENPARRREEEDALVQACAANLASLVGGGGDRAARETFLLQVLRGLPRDAPIALADVLRAVKEPSIAGIGDPDSLVKSGARTNLALGLNALVHGAAAHLFGGGVPLDLDAMLRPSRPGKVPLNVIYLNAMPNDDQKQFFVASLASEIYRWMITRASGEGGRTSFLFYVDEARDFLPAGGRVTMAKPPLLRLFAQGRKYGVGCLICTQSPRSVDYNAFTNCSTKLIGRLESAQDVDRVKEWFSDAAGVPPWLAGRKGAAKGSFVARWAEGPGETPFRGRPLFSQHGGAWPPEQVEREVQASLRTG